MRELSLNVLDVAENGLTAGATRIAVDVTVKSAEDLLIITIADDGNGMDEEMLHRVTDPFFTTRTTRKVGLGVPYLKMNAELTGGMLTVTSVPGDGTKVTASFGLRHIDRMPLGDMGQTMAQLAGANPQVRCIYRLSERNADNEDNTAFCFDTAEIQEILGSELAGEPEVIQFMTAYINENTEDILRKYKL